MNKLLPEFFDFLTDANCVFKHGDFGINVVFAGKDEVERR